MKVFISQPMSGKTEQEVREAREAAEKFLKEKFGDKLELIDSTYDPGFKEDEVKHFSAMCLAYSLTKMAEADLVYFCYGWQDARGCVIEHEVCEKYGIDYLPVSPIVNIEQNETGDSKNNGPVVVEETWNINIPVKEK